MVSAVFVYGTLQPGFLRWPVLARLVDGEPIDATVGGTLYDTGRGYSAAVFDRAATIPGVVVTLRDPTEGLEVLDGIEGVAVELFRRVQVTTAAGDVAWSYEWPGPVKDMPVIERWA